MKKFLLSSAALIMSASMASANELRTAVEADYEYILDLYKHFHANPELSFKESKSAARMIAELEPLGFTITEGVGDKWTKKKVKTDVGEVLDGVGGYGFVAVMENGDGPTLMLRADMDALPLEEKTGLDYASNVTQVDYRGQEAPVMHA
ncbi:MAG: amidohydrolase, partial [Marinicaulis sp.]|nr:amidohydrolase [Marinicaulis sp.]